MDRCLYKDARGAALRRRGASQRIRAGADSAMLGRDAHRVHQDARPRQRFHRLRCARRRPPADAPRAGARSPTATPASASTRRWCSSRRAAPAPMSSTASSTPTAARSSSAATARAASPPCCTAAALTRDGADRARQPGGPDPRAHARRQPASRSTWACRTSTRSRCPSKPPPRRTSIRSTVAGTEVRDRRGLDGQSARRAHGRPRSRARRWTGSGPPIEQSPALPEARERRVHGDRRSRRTSGCASSSVAPAKRSPAAPARAPLSRSADATAGSIRTVRSRTARAESSRSTGAARANTFG